MEKRTFLAIILSIFVLFGYQNLVVSKLPKNNQISSKILQPIENKEVKAEIVLEQNTVVVTDQVAPKVSVKEETSTLENDKLLVIFSNIGGTIKHAEVKGKETLPVDNLFSMNEYKNANFELISNGENKITYRLITEKYEIVKKFDLSNQEYLVNQEVLFKNISKMSNVNDLEISAIHINSELIKDRKDSENGLYEYSIASDMKVFRKSNAYKFAKNENKSEGGLVKWFGFRDKFYCAVFKPEFDSVGYRIEYITDNQLNMLIKSKPLVLNPGESIVLKSTYYFGPQDQEILKNNGLGDFVVFSQFWILDIISKAVVTVVQFIHKFVPSYGFCLIIVSILIYGAMYPLTMSGMMSMRKMQALQPKMAKLKEQYKSNPQKLNQEVMNLYKENSINPLGGCLPFILQMPVFIGLYQALWRSVIFQGQGFLWIKDLSMPDRLFILPNNIPLIGNEINILPLFMMVAMFFQQKLSTKNMITTDPNQLMQQKMMAWFFPIFLGVLFYKFASGLNLYFTVFYTLSTLTQLKMSKVKVVENA